MYQHLDNYFKKAKIDQALITDTFIDVSANPYNYMGLVNGPDGHIYTCPRAVTNIMKLNPWTRAYEFITTAYSGYASAVSASDGRIYFLPYAGSNFVIEYDPIGGGLSYHACNAGYLGGVEIDGNIYMCPYDATSVAKFNIYSKAVTYIGSLGGGYKWVSITKSIVNDCLYCMPYDAEYVMKIDPGTDTISNIGTSQGVGGNKNFGGCNCIINGNIYACPHSGTTLLVVNPRNDTTSNIGTLSISIAWCGIAQALDGNLYAAPFASSQALKIDPINNVMSTFGNFTLSTTRFSGIVLAVTGEMIMAPRSYPYAASLLNRAEVRNDIITSPYLDKY